MFTRTVLRNAFRGTSNSWSSIRRQYHQHRLVMLAPLAEVIDTPAAARTAVDKYFAFLTEQHAFAERTNCLTVVTFPEFWANWHTGLTISWPGDFVQTPMHNAGRPLTKETFQALVDRSCELVWGLPPGFLFAFGNVAVDTGAVDNSKTVGANVGWVLESGPSNDLVLVNKANFHPVDNWKHSVYVPRTSTTDLGGSIHPSAKEEHFGPYALTIVDPKTEERHGYTIYTCFDMVMGPHPEGAPGPRTMIANNAGTPPSWQLEWAQQKIVQPGDTVAVNESLLSARQGDQDGVFDAALVQRQVHPWLAPTAPASLHNVLLWFFHRVLGAKPTEAFVTELGFNRVGTTIVTSGGISAIVTAPRDIPTLPADQPGKVGTGV